MKRIYLSLFTLSTILVACGGSGSDIEVKKNDGEVTSSIAADADTDSESQKELEELQRLEEERIAKEKATSTTLEFNELRHEFGDVKADTDNKTEFIVTNTGNMPLIISDVSASCGCTTPKKPEGPIAPGESDVIAVNFHPKANQLGDNTKTVTVTANTMEKVHKLEIHANVLE